MAEEPFFNIILVFRLYLLINNYWHPPKRVDFWFLIRVILACNWLPASNLLRRSYKSASRIIGEFSKQVRSRFGRCLIDVANMKAIRKEDKFNAALLITRLLLIDLPEEIPEYIGFGDETEAIHYVHDALELWANDKKAMVWFINIHKKMKDKLDILIEKWKEKMKNFLIKPRPKNDLG